MSKIKAYVKLSLAKLTGDKDQQLVQKNYLKATSSIEGQIAALKSALVDRNQELQEAKEREEEATFPLVLIANQKAYADGLVRASKATTAAEEAVADVEASIEFFTKKLAEFNNEVDA